jgi:hypothetical protein
MPLCLKAAPVVVAWQRQQDQRARGSSSDPQRRTHGHCFTAAPPPAPTPNYTRPRRPIQRLPLATQSDSTHIAANLKGQHNALHTRQLAADTRDYVAAG